MDYEENKNYEERKNSKKITLQRLIDWFATKKSIQKWGDDYHPPVHSTKHASVNCFIFCNTWKLVFYF